MPDTPIQFTGSILERFETKVAADAPHLLPIVHAIRDHGVGFLVIPQHATGLDRGIKLLQRPFIVMVGDETDCALGPDQFDSKALDRLIGMADGVAIISCAPPPEAYSSIALMAMAQRNGLIIETRPEQEIAWTNRVQAVCPEMPILLCTVKGPRQ
ncbi:hypothetical protein [Albimonas pacifica]|uniref:Uncharacterized protein n=1 Tax=Albimonas pacifica TaxID=1114924 RepID=A0A1I3HXC3_9RHOB|nr:hypothetical protein [Albimonas pacifica]SFI40354.1 hypothetical protein SAMN05216258_106223 [Albimonas pacifica]